MAHNIFISFRYLDGHEYKEKLCNYLRKCRIAVDYSENIDRSFMSEPTIQYYIYKKIQRSSVTVVLLTPDAINHKKDCLGNYDDWMYDEIRYSLENREGNRTNGLIAVYTREAEKYLLINSTEGTIIKNVDNLFRANMMNILPQFKKNPTYDHFDMLHDSYCSLVSYEDFVNNLSKYIDNAESKRDERHKYKIVCRLNPHDYY